MMALVSPRHPEDDVTVTLLRRLALFVAFIVFAIILTFCYFASEFAISIILCAILAVLVDPAVEWLERRRLLGRPAASGVVVVCGSLIVLALCFGLYRRASAFVNDLPQYSRQIQRELSPILNKLHAAEGKKSGSSSAPTGGFFNIQRWSPAALGAVGSIRTLLVIAGVTPFLVFFMLVRKEQMYYRVIEILQGSLDAPALVDKLNTVLRGVAYSYLIAGSAMAAVFCAVFEVLHLHGAVVMGILCGYLNLIPYIGALLAIALALAGAMLQFTSIFPVITIVLVILLMHFVLANIVAPKWIGPRAEVGPAAVIAGMLFWGWLWGIIGIVLAIPLTAALKVVADQHPGLTYFSDLLADNLHLAERKRKAEEKAQEEAHKHKGSR